LDCSATAVVAAVFIIGLPIPAALSGYSGSVAAAERR